jgi:hypothetical protein
VADVLGDVVAEGVGEVAGQGGQGALAGGLRLQDEAREGELRGESGGRRQGVKFCGMIITNKN